MKEASEQKPVRMGMRIGFFIIYWFIKYIPWFISGAVLTGFCHLLYAVAGKIRRVSMRNLRLAFHNKIDEKKMKTIAKRSFTSFLETTAEIICYDNKPEQITRDIHFNDKPLIDSLLAKGKGIVIVTAHFGHFQLMIFRLAKAGYKVNTIINPLKDVAVDDFFAERALANGVRLIPSVPGRVCVVESYKVLAKNEILVILPDQNYGAKNRVFVRMFGKLAGTASSPIIFSAKAGAPVLPVFTVKRDSGWDIVCEPPMEFEEKDLDSSELVKHVQALTNIFERYIIQYPEHWLWMHNRFKTVPTEEELEKINL